MSVVILANLYLWFYLIFPDTTKKGKE